MTGRENRLSFGLYPEVSLKVARKLLADGIDPGGQWCGERARRLAEDSFEAVAREWIERQRCERLGYPFEVIEHQLARAVPDALGRAYNRTRFLEQRRADYLDRPKAGAEGVPLLAGDP